MKKEVLFTYPAIFHFEDGQYWCEFIDLKGCFSSGTTLPEAMENSKEAMGLYLEGLEEYPKCTTNIQNIKLLCKKFNYIIYISLIQPPF